MPTAVEPALERRSESDYSNNPPKSAAIAAERLGLEEGAERVRTFEHARQILRDKTLLQGGGGAGTFDIRDPDRCPVFYLDGEPHRQKRANIARFFTPKAVTTRYHALIERETDRLLGQLRRDGRAKLDVLSFELTVAVVADIVGLTNSDLPKMSRRLAMLLSASWYHHLGFFARTFTALRKSLTTMSFYRNDVMPALRARREHPQSDILSHLIDNNASHKMILIECMTYAAAGMVTTREFIVMAAWYMLERPQLREDFLASDQDRQIAILLEILRVEPIASLLYRRTDPADASAPPRLYALDLRAAHTDEDAVGPCPHAIDPERAARLKTNGAFLSFGSGTHHCPGWQLALHEARLFLDRLLRLPDIQLERQPDIRWSKMLMSYELRDAVVTCAKG